MGELFVIVMPVGPKYQHQYGIVEDSVHQAVLLSDVPAPTSLRLTLQRLWVAGSRLGMLHKFKKHFCHLLKCFWLMALQLLHFQLCLIGVFKLIHGGQRLLRKLCNSSAEFIRCVFPCLYSSSPRLRLSKNSSRETSVGSACFSATSLRRYLAVRFSRFSSSAIMLMLRRISAFICIAVIPIL